MGGLPSHKATFNYLVHNKLITKNIFYRDSHQNSDGYVITMAPFQELMN